MITRRGFLKFLGRMVKTGAVLGTYAFVIEPGFFLRTQHWSLTPPNWRSGLKLRLVMLADPHLVEPHMPLSRWQGIIEKTNTLDGDLILLMGDYVAGHFFRTGTVPVA